MRYINLNVFKKNNKKQKTRENRISLIQQRKKLLNNKTDFFITEEYNSLRTNILFSSTKSGCKIFGITSPNEGEGKSTTCVNLALSLIKHEKKVLIIDADFRYPKVGKLLNISNSPGLSNLLIKQISLSDVISTKVCSYLDFMPAGTRPPNPSEILGTSNMEELLLSLRDCYDYILIDLPPVNIVTDAVVLSHCLDGILLIARSNYTKREDLLESINKLNAVNAKITGIILTRVERNTKAFGRYGKHNKYGKYNKYSKYSDAHIINNEL